MLRETMHMRRVGVIGALMHEYHIAGDVFVNAFDGVSEAAFSRIVDPESKDENCRSLKAIVRHVVSSGYVYANYIRTTFHESADCYDVEVSMPADVSDAIARMLQYTEQSVDGRWEMTDEEIISTRIATRWGVTYDLEQLFEHAIVHLLRHRRQVEYFGRVCEAAGC